MDLRPVLLVIAATLASGPAGAGMLYKSVSADGRIMFSDVPPADGARIVSQREIGANGTIANAASRTMEAIENLLDADGAVARANSDVDMAEHALALAR